MKLLLAIIEALYWWLIPLAAFLALGWFQLDQPVLINLSLVVATWAVSWVVWYLGYKFLFQK